MAVLKAPESESSSVTKERYAIMMHVLSRSRRSRTKHERAVASRSNSLRSRA